MSGIFSNISPKDCIIYSRKHPKRNADFVDYPVELLPQIKDYLNNKGFSQLYSHQTQMFDLATKGKNVVITTSTASGKTLSFLLPVLQEVLQHPSSRALFIYPTKALASDQMRTISDIINYFGDNSISAGVYDGDTKPNERYRIRNEANIILTNPDMINQSFLPNHSNSGFSYLFSNLKYIVIDELHTYRGAFGSHVANLFRRMQRICNYYSSSPRFLCSSATIANPIELAQNICGKEFELVYKDGSPSDERRYYFIQPPTYGKKTVEQIPATEVAVEFIPELVLENHSFIAFCQTRRNVEVVLRESRERLSDVGDLGYNYSELIAGYRAGYKPKERKDLEEKMVSGKIKGLISTNALELGIDIGKIDTALLVGYPGTKASFWQQSGRAGRKGISDTYLILNYAPLDQYLATDPNWLFETKSESAVVDNNNLFVQLAHIRAAAAELPLSLDDQALFPDISEIIPVLMNSNDLRFEHGKFTWSGNGFPAGDFSLRNIDNERYKLLDNDSNIIAEFDETQAFNEIHLDSIYIHNGQSYHITRFDKEAKIVYAELINANYYTETQKTTIIKIISKQKEKDVYRINVKFGDVNVTNMISGHKMIQFHNRQNLGYYNLEQPLSKELDTEAIWITLPDNVQSVLDKTSSVIDELSSSPSKTYLGAISYCIYNSTMMSTMTIHSDIDYSRVIYSENEPCEAICIYDCFHGGMGYAEKTYELIDTIINNAVKRVRDCHCKYGCPACIGTNELDKSVVLWSLENLIKESEFPKKINDIKIPKIEKKIIKKPFSLQTLNWDKFKEFIQQTGEKNSLFISKSVRGIKTDNNTLILQVDNSIALMQAQSEENLKQIKNIIEYYVDVPIGFNIDFELIGPQESENKEKLTKHYKSLTGR